MIARILCRSARELPPTHFATVAPRKARATQESFGKESSKFFASLLRLVPGLQYFRIREWKGGRVHDHALIRANRVPRRAVRAAKKLAGVKASVRPLRSMFKACRYIVKTGRWVHKAEPIPVDFQGKLFTSSRGFLVYPRRKLWAEIQAERAEKREGAN